ncbi:DUF1963 domain-containing protein [Pseudomonas sichuanensis]|uniref:DUF1963 domain-containing protein n=1 Tax=Pseudomonas sichuanensis TaxID=2213015 RepID=UPI00215E65E8|nr:DUF1963 domain-containing protein [Pseudomonas sichuanensis]UVL88581.1 DUF1963 domain-containing protein [Pseudomonas sichuanensis]
MKVLKFKETLSENTEPHSGGSCLLPDDQHWPVDTRGEPQLHLMTIPAAWIEEGCEGWLSFFTPYDQEDTYLHWETLTSEAGNASVVLLHDNSGIASSGGHDSLSPARLIQLDITDEAEPCGHFKSRVSQHIAWLQDCEQIEGHACHLMVNGDDFDVGLAEAPGVFSDGVVYVFLSTDFHKQCRPGKCGLMTFQFS